MPGDTGGSRPGRNDGGHVARRASPHVTCDGAQKLPHDLLWLIGRNYLDRPADVYALAATSRRVWQWLRPELYVTDILYTRDHRDRWAQYVEGETALIWSIANDHVETAQEVIRLAARLWPGYVNMRNLDDLCAVDACARRGHAAVLRTLLESDACELGGMAMILNSNPVLHSILSDAITQIDPSCRPSCGRHDKGFPCGYAINALGIAVASGHLEVARILLDHAGPQAWVMDTYNEIQAVHVAALVNSAPAMAMLLEAGYDAFVGSTYFKAANAFHLAAAKGGAEIIKLLCSSIAHLAETERRALLEWRDKYGRGPMEYAALHGHLEEYPRLIGYEAPNH